MHDSACDVIVGIANEKNFGFWGNHMGLKLEIEYLKWEVRLPYLMEKNS